MKNFNTFSKVLTGIFVLFFLFSSSAPAIENGAAPTNLKAVAEKSGKARTIKLTWDYTSNQAPEYFFIYIAEGNSEDMDDFKLAEKMKYKKGDFQYIFNKLKGNEYSFYVTAAYRDHKDYEESEPSNIAFVSDSSGDNYYLKITSKYQLNGEAGKQFEFRVQTQTNAPKSCPVVFELADGPEGMEINEENGGIEWTPKTGGNYTFKVKAYLECNKQVTAEAEFQLMVKGGHYEKLYVKITSEPDDDLEAGDTMRFMLEAKTNAPDSCTILWELAGDVPEGMELIDNSSSTVTDEAGYYVTWAPENEGVCYFAVKAYLDCNNEVFTVSKFAVRVEEGDDDHHNDKDKKKLYLKIVSSPCQFGDAGEEWTYTVKAETNAPDSCMVVYSLSDDAPEGMELIDFSSSTVTDIGGTSLTWTPEEPGVYQFWLYATLGCDDKVTDKQRIVINIKKKTADELCAVIKGTVTGEDSVAIPEGRIMAWRVDDKSDNSEFKQVYKLDFKDGTYELNVSEGTYVVKASAFKFKDEWYENTMGIEHATRIDVECDNEYEVPFMLEADSSLCEPSSATFTGAVVSAADSTPVQAVVEFIPTGSLGNAGTAKPKLSKYTAVTDSTGKYSIEVEGGLKFIAFAIPETGSGLMSRYYIDAADPFEADIINSESSTMTIVDFALPESEEWVNGFGGTVLNDNNEPLQSKLVAYLAEPAEDSIGRFTYAQITESDETGAYEFTNLIPGKYLLLSIPLDKEYVPGYYHEDSLVVFKWKKSGLIDIDSTFDSLEYVLIHKLRKAEKGIGKTSGHIKKHHKGMIKFDGGIPQGDEIVVGAFVYALDSQNEVAGYALTDDAGAFILDELSAGKYTLAADKAGMEAVESDVSIDYETSLSVDVDLSMGEQEVNDVKDDTPAEAMTDFTLYPLPANDFITVDFATARHITSIEMYSLRGNRIFTDHVNTTIKNRKFDISGLSTGTYILRIRAERTVTDMTISIIR